MAIAVPRLSEHNGLLAMNGIRLDLACKTLLLLIALALARVTNRAHT